MEQIIAMGGGGFSMEPENLALDRYVLEQTAAARPRVCFLGQASAESPEYATDFYRAFTKLSAVPSHLSVFKPHTADIEDFLLAQDVVYAGGGNTKSMLALWREWEIDRILRKALRQGVVLAGISAGAICWFEQGTTDSKPGELTLLPCLGLLKGSCSPHYDGEPERRPTLHRMIASGEALAGHAFDDGAAGHFIDGTLHAVVGSRSEARGYYVASAENSAQETVLDTRKLPACR